MTRLADRDGRERYRDATSRSLPVSDRPAPSRPASTCAMGRLRPATGRAVERMNRTLLDECFAWPVAQLCKRVGLGVAAPRALREDHER